MTIEAVKTRVLFTRKETQKQTDSGIILSNPHENNPLGYVHSVGSEVTIPDIGPGDAISVNWNAVGMIEYRGEKYYVVDQSNINAIVIES